MAMAICFKCGSAKSGALIACRTCNAVPRTNNEYAVSLALSDHLSSKGQLAQYSHELRNGKKLSVPREALTQAFDALKDAQLLEMLGAQPAAQDAALPPPHRPPATQSQPQAPAESRAAPSTSIEVTGTNVYTNGGLLREAIGIETFGRSFTTILAKGSKLPCAVSQNFSTGEDGQDQITLHLCTGDSSASKISQPLGRYQICGIARMPRGKPSIVVEFRADLGGITLKVTDNLAQSTLAVKSVASPSEPIEQPRVESVQRPTPSNPATRFTATALNKSPFAVLGATTRDNRRRIVELAEEKSLELDHDLCQKARADLTNPRTRLAAEIAWLPGVSPRKASQLVDGLLQNPMALREESGLPTLAHLNLMASVLETVNDDHDSDDLAAFIQEVARLAEEISPQNVLRDINEDRAVSGFPEVKTLEQVEEELSERRRYYRNAIKETLDRLPSAKLVQVMTDTVDGATSAGKDHAPGLIDDLVDSYEVETQGFLQREAENIDKLITTTRDFAETDEATVRPYIDKIDAVARNWNKIARPIQLSSKARGIHHDPSRELAWAIRSLAVDLFNNHDMLEQSQRLTALIREIFSQVPDVTERVGEDAEALSAIQQRRSESAAIDPIRNLVEGALKDIECNPSTANNDGERLLSEGLSMLKAAPIEIGSPTYREAENILAVGIMRCAIAYGNQTSKWEACISLLQRALEIASDADLRKKLDENLTIVRRNSESLGDLEPIKSAPALRTINGIGVTLYGNTDPKPDGSHMATYYFVFFFIPIFPISRYRVIPTAGGYRFLGKGALRTFDYWHMAISIGVILLMFLKG